VHLGEFGLLWRDVRSVPTFGTKLAYMLRPPGWRHDGETRTATARKAELDVPVH
jgi:hypothetical protein